jgi:hypothetical protein
MKKQYVYLGDARFEYKCPNCGESNWISYYTVIAQLDKQATVNTTCLACKDDVELVPLP